MVAWQTYCQRTRVQFADYCRVYGCVGLDCRMHRQGALVFVVEFCSLFTVNVKPGTFREHGVASIQIAQ